MENFSLYVHIPFCVSKCNYCDFLSFAQNRNNFAPYISALEREILAKAAENPPKVVASLYFGGGTPSVLGDILCQLLYTLKRAFRITEAAEVTTELNPESASYPLLRNLKQAGFNRLSFGIQSFNDAELRLLGRAHTAATAIEAVQAAQSAGFDNINLDLMFALPNQTPASWQKTLQTAVSLNPAHLSAYGLTIEEGAPFAAQGVTPMDDEADRLMYHEAQAFLKQQGYPQYELSNFAQDGKSCRHNLTYWSDIAYLGLGLGAHSYMSNTRYHNTADMSEYLAGDFAPRGAIDLSKADRMSEFMFLGLRLTEGVSKQAFTEKFGLGVDVPFGKAIAENIRGGLLEDTQNRLRLTASGMDLANRVFSSFLL